MGVLQLNGIDMHYQLRGKGPTLILIHGLGSSEQDWEFQIPALEKNYQVITCDVRGHGKSSKPKGPYSIKQFASDIAELISQLHLEKPHVAGISMGGMIGLELALNHPESLRSLTIINSVPNVTIRPITMLKRWLVLNLFGMKGLARCLAEPLLPGQQHEELRKKLIQRWAKTDKQAYKAAAQAVLEWTAVDRLHILKVPVAVISSEHDYWSLALKKKLFEPVPDIQFFEIPDAHHLAPMEFPEKFNECLGTVLASLPEK